MKCPKCNSGTGVVDSRPREDGRIYRRRECFECWARFTTSEEIVSDGGGISAGRTHLANRVTRLSEETVAAINYLLDRTVNVEDRVK